MKILLKLFTIFTLLLTAQTSALSEELVFGLLPGNLDLKYFTLILQACQNKAALNNDSCEMIGEYPEISTENQALVLKDAALSERYDSFALSVFLPNEIEDTVVKYISVPVITFASPFLPKDASLSSAYVGPDNIRFGKDMASTIRKQFPSGGNIFILGDLNNPDIIQRVIALRRDLGSTDSYDGVKKLNGQGAWFEHPTSPWGASSSIKENSVKLDFILNHIRPDVLVSVYDSPLIDDVVYRKIISNSRKTASGKDAAVLVGAGEITPELQALIDEGLIDGIVCIDFSGIGRTSYSLMRTLVNGGKPKRWNYIPNIIVTAESRSK